MERRGGSSIVGSTGTRLAKQMHQRIEHVRRYAQACAAIFTHQRVNVAEPINCGSYGCVYPAGPNRVAKVSFDAGEAELGALFARVRGAHPAIPLVFYVGQAPAKCGTYARGHEPKAPLYLIVREDLADVLPFIELEAKNRLNLSLMDLDEADYPGFGEKVDLAVSALREYPRALRFYQQAVAFAVWGLEHDLFLGDTHIDNWGARDGKQIVLRDFGLASSSKAPSYRSLPTLQGLGRAVVHARRVGLLGGLGRLGFRVRGTRRR